jgi:hypothetical protein
MCDGRKSVRLQELQKVREASLGELHPSVRIKEDQTNG